MSGVVPRPASRPTARPTGNGAPPSTRDIWDQHELAARELEFMTGKARALEISQDPDEIDRILEDDLPTIVDVLERVGDSGASVPVAASTRKPLTFRTARQLAESTPEQVPWAVTWWLAYGAITELDGRPKASGKTTFILAMIRALLDGADFLGHPTHRGPVVMLSEQGDTSLRDSLSRAGLLDRDDLLLLTWSDASGIPWAEIVKAAEAEAQRIGARVLVVDTLPQFAGLRGDTENDAGAALEAIEPLQRIRAQGFAVLLGRHDRKGGGVVGESARGSGAFTGAVDIVLALSRDARDPRPTMRHLEALSRFGATPSDLMIELVDGQYVALGAIETVKATALRDALLELLPLPGEEPTRPDELTEAAGKDEATIKQALNRMLAESPSPVARHGKGRKGDPYRWCRAGQDAGVISGALTTFEQLSERNPRGRPGGESEEELLAQLRTSA